MPQVLSEPQDEMPALAPEITPADGQPGLREAALISKGFGFAAQLRILSDVVLIENSYAEQSGRSSSGYSSACVGERNLGYLQVQRCGALSRSGQRLFPAFPLQTLGV